MPAALLRATLLERRAFPQTPFLITLVFLTTKVRQKILKVFWRTFGSFEPFGSFYRATFLSPERNSLLHQKF